MPHRIKAGFFTKAIFEGKNCKTFAFCGWKTQKDSTHLLFIYAEDEK